MKTFSTYQITIGKKDIERKVLCAYRQENYNSEFLPGEIRYAPSFRKFHGLKMMNFELMITAILNCE
jgi:hypothetical protein